MCARKCAQSTAYDTHASLDVDACVVFFLVSILSEMRACTLNVRQLDAQKSESTRIKLSIKTRYVHNKLALMILFMQHNHDHATPGRFRPECYAAQCLRSFSIIVRHKIEIYDPKKYTTFECVRHIMTNVRDKQKNMYTQS